jgi:HSP20 family protein
MFDLMPFRNRSRRGKNQPTASEDAFDVFKSNLLDDFMDVTRRGFKVDVKETDEEFIIEAELPGLEKDDITLEMEGERLTISVQEEDEFKEETENYVRKERRTGNYQRSFILNNVQEDKIEAQYNNGILEVTLPKEEPGTGKRREIDIN